MEAIESRQLLSYQEAMELANLAERTLYKKIRQHGIPVYIRASDRRVKLLDRNDVLKIARPVERHSVSAA